MLTITFKPTTAPFGTNINIFGNITGSQEKVVCSISHEFLADINGGSLEYEQTLHENRMSIENIAEDKLNLLDKVALSQNPIKIQIHADDAKILNY